jgi:hypothetical protein
MYSLPFSVPRFLEVVFVSVHEVGQVPETAYSAMMPGQAELLDAQSAFTNAHSADAGRLDRQAAAAAP